MSETIHLWALGLLFGLAGTAFGFLILVSVMSLIVWL